MGRALLRFLAPVGVAGLLVGTWHVAAEAARSPFFPPLTEVAQAFRELWLSASFVDQAVPSFVRAGLGFGLALAAGVVVGSLIGLSPLFRALTKAQLEFLRAIPPVLLIPPSILLLGTGDSMKVVVIALSAVWPILLAAVDGVRSVEAVRIDAARVFGLDRARQFRWVVLPSAVPRIWSGVRAAVPIALVVMVAADYYASSDGLGYMISQTATRFRFSEMWASVILLGIFGALVNLAVIRLGRRFDKEFGEFGEPAS